MRTILALSSALLLSLQANAQDFNQISSFAEDICGDIPEGRMSKTQIEGKLSANAGRLFRLFGASGKVVADHTSEFYRGIPLANLPDRIPTVSMCKSELVRVIFQREKISVPRECRHPDFGRVGWRQSETITDSSGRVSGGRDQIWWCNRVTESFLSSRQISGPKDITILQRWEESRKDWKGHVTYKYHCKINFKWNPVYRAQADADRCGVITY